MVYNLGCTRRCIECGHTMCTSRDVAAAKREAIMGGSSRRAGKQRRRRRGGPCVSEFDFAGWQAWAAWAAWRRGLQSRQGQGQDGDREQRFANGTHSCPSDCNYPSECHRTRRRLLREQALRSMVADCSGSTGAADSSPKPESPATTATTTTVGSDEEMQEESGEASVATGETFIEPRDEAGRGDREAEEILSGSVMVVDPEEIHSSGDSDNASDDSDDSEPRDMRDQLTFTMVSGGNSSSFPCSSTATPEYEEMHDTPPSPPAGDEGYDSDVDGDDNNDDDDDGEDDDPSALMVADRQRRNQLKLYRLTGSDAFLPVSTQPTSAAAPSRNPRGRHCYQPSHPLPPLAEEEDEDCEINRPSSASPSSSPPTTRSSSRASGGGGGADDDDDDGDHGGASRWPAATAGSTNEDIAELMRFRSAFMRGEL